MGVELTQYEFDSLVSFAFNVGNANFGGSTLLQYVNAGERNKIGADFLKWNHSAGKVVAGLAKGRRAEANMFLYGLYGSSN